MRTTAFCLLALATSAMAQSWCATAPVPASRLQTIAKEVKGEFRGTFREFALFVDASGMDGCKPFAPYTSGNDGLWVIEFHSSAEKTREIAKARSNNLAVLLETNTTAVVAGGELVPDKLGYDACGTEKVATIISVSPTPVKAVPPMSPAQLAKRALKKKSAIVQQVIDSITPQDMATVITHLESYNSRNSYTGSDLPAATQWLAEQYAAAGLNVTRHSFNTDIAQQVIAEFPGQPGGGVVVIGAHSDSRSTQTSNPTQRAPGGDDNGSGTAALVLIARAIRSSGIQLKHTLRLISFTGEEQGLLGSRAIAREYAANGEDIVVMVNGDMLGYRLPGQPITLALMDRNANLEWSEWATEIMGQYVPNLPTGWTAACCSDQQAFHENGFPAISIFEHPGNNVQYPQYHTSSDLLQYLDQDQLMLEAKAMAASGLVWAEPLDA